MVVMMKMLYNEYRLQSVMTNKVVYIHIFCFLLD
jgi:hypothetical protein